MNGNKHFGANLTGDPDDAPELLEGFFRDAEIRRGETVMRPAARGRPKSATPKQSISVRLDADVVAKLREGGTGWQSRINNILRDALGLRSDKPAA